MMIELARVAGAKSTWAGQWEEYRVRVFKTGIHWTYELTCDHCDLHHESDKLCATKSAAASYAWDDIQRDKKESLPSTRRSSPPNEPPPPSESPKAAPGFPKP